MTEENDYTDYATDYEVAEPEESTAPEALIVNDPPATKPEWSLGKTGHVAYGDSGPEVDYINSVFGIDAASFTKATEEAVREYRKRLDNTGAGFVGYRTYKTL